MKRYEGQSQADEAMKVKGGVEWGTVRTHFIEYSRVKVFTAIVMKV